MPCILAGTNERYKKNNPKRLDGTELVMYNLIVSL
jgi:hypothetical protein